jgi:hypothetical protein
MKLSFFLFSFDCIFPAKVPSRKLAVAIAKVGHDTATFYPFANNNNNNSKKKKGEKKTTRRT